LGYAFTKKIRDESRINISDKYKFVINSPEVQFVIKRLHAKVKHKNIIMFSYKNHLDRFCINTKQFIINDLQHNFVSFLVQKLVMA
jgi:bifunctional DNA-binding transcriptional regulator/antitoxin component of YhaV-PrlF toxin-antitoxin module